MWSTLPPMASTPPFPEVGFWFSIWPSIDIWLESPISKADPLTAVLPVMVCWLMNLKSAALRMSMNGVVFGANPVTLLLTAVTIVMLVGHPLAKVWYWLPMFMSLVALKNIG